VLIYLIINLFIEYDFAFYQKNKNKKYIEKNFLKQEKCNSNSWKGEFLLLDI
jgi:hypothetical protein